MIGAELGTSILIRPLLATTTKPTNNVATHESEGGVGVVGFWHRTAFPALQAAPLTDFRASWPGVVIM